MADDSPPAVFQESRRFSTNYSHKVKNSLYNLVDYNRGKSFTIKSTLKY